jgi:hypothetical protein
MDICDPATHWSANWQTMPFKNGKVCLRATSEAGARWPIFGLVVATTTSRRDNKDQMIRPIEMDTSMRDAGVV